ncbi:arylsulfatase [Rubritalea sp.]|uniref:arylsulfatase n=1 Tax=Rubritalea sp. TaxID=2109375 RepID=UPI003EF31AFD
MKPLTNTIQFLKNRGKLPVCSVMCTGLMISGIGLASGEVITQKPNILLLVADDTAFGDIGAFGSEVKTPNMNRIAQSGVRFTNFHVSPVCSVTRSMLLTGNDSIEVGLGAFDYSVYPATRGKKGYETYLTDDAVTISELLNDAGYEVYKSGKWHLGGDKPGSKGPLVWGFTKEFGIYSGGSNHWNNLAMTPDFHDPEGLTKKRVEEWTLNGKPFDRPSGIYSGEIYTKYMLDFIKDGAKKEKPWFAYMAFTTAHFPIQAPEDLIMKYYPMYLELGYAGLKKARYESLKKHGLISHEATEAPFNNLTKRWEDLTQKDKEKQAKIMATYAAMIEDQDNRIGQILDYLETSGQLDNTLVVYLTDNGPEGLEPTNPKTGNPELAKWIENQFDSSFEAIGTANSENVIGTSWANAATGGLQWWKWFIGEGGIRVPMMIVPPGGFSEHYERAGEKSNAVVYVKDIPMTILEYAKVKHPKTKYKNREIVEPSGISIKPFLDGKSEEVRSEKDWWAFELFGNGYLMQGEFKAMKVRTGMFGDGKWHLYNVVSDPSESKPLESKHPDKLKKMIKLYESHVTQNNILEVDAAWNPFQGASE